MEIRKIESAAEAPAIAMAAPLTPQERSEQLQLVHAVEAVNKAELFGQKNELTFAFDRQSRRTIMQLVDKETQEVIRQIPPEYVLRLADETHL